jgi:hypothetical protein
MKTLKTVANERGFVLLVVYIVIICISIVSIAFFARHQGAIQATERYQNRVLAFNASESGIDFALRGLSENTAMIGTPPSDGTPPEDTIFAAPYYTSAITSMGQNAFQFKLFYVPGERLRRRIESKGCAPDCTATSRAYQASSITVYCKFTETTSTSPLFEYGVYSKDLISMSGNSAFDSYNSNNGAYGGSNKNSTGQMAVNSTQIGTFTLSGNAKINGDALVSYDGNPSTVITSGNAAITGVRSNLPQDLTSPAPVEVPAEATNLNLVVSGNNTITLAPGTYHASSLAVSGNGKIVATGAVQIYVDGSINITGNGVAVSGNLPANLLLYSAGSSTVNIAGNGSFYGGIYAPNSIVTASGNGDIFGAVIAKTYTQSGNSATHFDLALNGVAVTNQQQADIVRITAWEELNSLA